MGGSGGADVDRKFRNRAGVSRFDSHLFTLVRFSEHRVKSLAGSRVDVGWFAEDHRQHVVAGGDFRQVDVGLEANPLQVGDVVGR